MRMLRIVSTASEPLEDERTGKVGSADFRFVSFPWVFLSAWLRRRITTLTDDFTTYDYGMLHDKLRLMTDDDDSTTRWLCCTM